MAAKPYVQGWREWDERYADLVLGKRNWQAAAGCSLLVSFVLAVGVVWLALQQPLCPVCRRQRQSFYFNRLSRAARELTV